MKTLQLNNMGRRYKNNGQHLEQVFRYTMTGEIIKADNVAHDMGTDFGHYSIKSARATVCKGLDLVAYLDTDKATEFVYITKTEVAYIMTRAEYIAFCEEFAKPDRESKSNGETLKLRLGKETQKMLEWLIERAQPSPVLRCKSVADEQQRNGNNKNNGQRPTQREKKL